LINAGVIKRNRFADTGIVQMSQVNDRKAGLESLKCLAKKPLREFDPNAVSPAYIDSCGKYLASRSHKPG
jgi:hypothetical protein